MPLQFVTSQIADDAITSAKIVDEAIVPAKLDLTSQTYDFSSATLRAGTPSAGTDVANKTYVDNVANGLFWKQAVEAATTAQLPAVTYNNGSSGVGATLTADANGALAIDSVTLSAGDRVLIKDQPTGGSPSLAVQNGIYTITTLGDGSNPFVLTRTTDMDEADEFAGSAVFVMQGSTNEDTGYVCVNDGSVTIGTNDVQFAQFTGAGALSAGQGIAISGNTVSVNLAASGGLDFNGSDELQVADNGITLEKNKMRWQYEDFTTVANLTFTLAQGTSTIPSNFQNIGNIAIFKNGQLLIAESGTGSPSDADGYKVNVDGSDLKVMIGTALSNGERLQARYLYNG